MEALRAAIAGTGNIARVHARALSEATGPAASLVAVMDVDDRKPGPFRRDFGIRETYRTLDDPLSHGRPGLVHVCTPPSTHYELALGCLRAGVSVLVEKPPTISLREFDELTAAEGTSRGPWFATVFQHRFGSGQRRLKALAGGGALGCLHRAVTAARRRGELLGRSHLPRRPLRPAAQRRRDAPRGLRSVRRRWQGRRRPLRRAAALGHRVGPGAGHGTPPDRGHRLAGRRRLGARLRTALTNASDRRIDIGSPTTEGRPDAGYGGFFWRGPRSFTGGTVVTPEGTGGDELMGSRGPWLAFAGRHDGSGGASTLVFRDAPGNFCHPTQWFARSTPFAAVCPAPFFDKVRALAPGETLTLSYQVVVAGGELGPAACAVLAARAEAADLIQVTGE